MADGPCTVDINGTSYYAPCDSHDTLIQVGSYLINTSSSSITLYAHYPTYGDSTTGYPRIVCPTNTKAYIRQSSSSSTVQTLNVSSFKFKDYRFENSYILSVLMLGVLVCLLFKR